MREWRSPARYAGGMGPAAILLALGFLMASAARAHAPFGGAGAASPEPAFLTLRISDEGYEVEMRSTIHAGIDAVERRSLWRDPVAGYPTGELSAWVRRWSKRPEAIEFHVLPEGGASAPEVVLALEAIERAVELPGAVRVLPWTFEGEALVASTARRVSPRTVPDGPVGL